MHRGFALGFLLLFLCIPAAGQSPSGVVINEVFTGSPDWIEIRNFSGSSQDISGWSLQASFAFTTYPTFTFPANSSLAPGECILVLENANQAPLLTNQPPINTQILNTYFGYGWIGTSAGALALVDATNALQDFLPFGITGHSVPQGAANAIFPSPLNRLANHPSTGNVMYRHNSTDTDDGGDWSQSTNGSETPGAPNPGQARGPQPIESLIFSPNTGVAAVDPNTNVIQISANIVGVVLDDGREIYDPNWDVIIGGNLQVQATAATPVTSDLNSLILTPCKMVLTAANSELLTLRVILAAEPTTISTLAGPLAASPRLVRPLRTASTITQNTLSGTTSAALSQLHRLILNSPLYLEMRIEQFGARLIALNTVSPATGPLRTKISNSGSGSLKIGVVGATQSELYNVFVINPWYDVGAGSVFGISWDSWQWQQVWTPLGSQPFHVAPTPLGTYEFQSPPGTVPPGVWLDFLAIEVINGNPVASKPTRAFF